MEQIEEATLLLPELADIIHRYIPLEDMKAMGIPITSELLESIVGPTPLSLADFEALSTTPYGVERIIASIMLGEIPAEFVTDVIPYLKFSPSIDSMIIKRLIKQYTPLMVSRLIRVIHSGAFDVTESALNKIVKYVATHGQAYEDFVRLMQIAIRLEYTRVIKKMIQKDYVSSYLDQALKFIPRVRQAIIDAYVPDSKILLYLRFKRLDELRQYVVAMMNSRYFNPSEIMMYLQQVPLIEKNRSIFRVISEQPEFQPYIDWSVLAQRASTARKSKLAADLFSYAKHTR